MITSVEYFKYFSKTKTFCCNINTLLKLCKDWGVYTHSLVLWNPKTNNRRQFVLQQEYSNHYYYTCGDLSLKVYYQKKESKHIVAPVKENLFRADEGGIERNFLEDFIRQIEEQEHFAYEYEGYYGL
jgi:hypothetical protein